MTPAGKANGVLSVAVVAWLITSIYYFYQYVLRSAPAVMMPQLSEAFGLTTAGLSSLVGVFYYGYAPFSLIAGVAMDQLGPRKVMPLGAALLGVGAFLFATGDATLAGFGRFLQGAAGVFALIGAAYIASAYFPPSRAATLIGATQMMGMAGGSAGQFLVGPATSRGMPWSQFWIGGGVAGLVIAVLLLMFTPSRRQASAEPARARPRGAWAKEAVAAMVTVFRNPQSILCGLITGLLFMPTTIFDMVWGVRFLQEAHDIPYSLAVMRSASIPLGWIIGCPLFGALSDRVGRRKPFIVGGASVLLVCLMLILFGPHDRFPQYSLGLIAGIASGAAMLPYTVIKEANRPEHGGTATGVVNFIAFSMTAVFGPIFGGLLMRASAGGERELAHYQAAFEPLIYSVGLVLILSLFLRETGAAVRSTTAAGAPSPETNGPGGATTVKPH